MIPHDWCIITRIIRQLGTHYPDPGAGQNTLRRLALFLYLNHPTTNDVTSGQNRSKIGAALVSVKLKSEVSVECDFFVFVNQHFHGILL